jgi:hypothetical protein
VTKVSRWCPRVEWCALWLEEQGPDGPGAASWGQYVGVVLDRQWRWGRTHVYYNAPHDQFSIGPLHFCWSLDWCDDCLGNESEER